MITDAAVKAKLVPVSWNQAQPADCSHLVVFALRKNLGAAHVERYLARIAEVRGVSSDSLSGFGKMLNGALGGAAQEGTLDVWQTHQIYIALGQFMTSAALLGIDTCPMEGIERAKYDEVLGLSGTELTTVVACAAGYRAASDKYATTKKVRFAPDEVIVRVG